VKFAYADPPYLGVSKFGAAYHYGGGHPEASDYDSLDAHASLIERLVSEFPDGWALSLHTPSLKPILGLCPDDVRIAAWVKSFASFKPNVNPAYAWEPVIFCGGRRGDRSRTTVRDWFVCPITLQRGLTGAKPPEVCAWILELLGYEEGDELADLFPGTGVMGRVLAQQRLTV
jgi:hypothetical protein